MNTEINSNTVFLVEDYENVPVQQNYEDIEFDISWTNTFINIWINDIPVIEESDDYSSQTFTYNGVNVENAGNTSAEGTNVIRLQPRFGDYPVDEFTINGTVYNAENQDVTIQNDEWTITVPGATKYTISGTGNTNAQVPRTIIWANVDADNSADGFKEDMVLEHGRAKIVAVYDGDTQISGETDVDANTGMGWVQVVPGSRVVFEFVPEYGYQLTSVKANGFDLEPQDTINQYEFIMPDTNVHFQAVFTRTNDVVDADSEKVESGTITLGENLAGGSAMLTVKDIELSADKISDFENAAGDYSISNYLDIDLYNIFYKGKNDADDVWTNKIDELAEEATITIKLADGIDVNDIVIVHNIHDGEQFEVIEIESYDRETNTITFKTKSFSNYAIATKNSNDNSVNTNTNTTNTVKTNEKNDAKSTNPNTHDGIIKWIIISIISVIGLSFGVLIFRKLNTRRV